MFIDFLKFRAGATGRRYVGPIWPREITEVDGEQATWKQIVPVRVGVGAGGRQGAATGDRLVTGSGDHFRALDRGIFF
jgi:hypothetical protein